MDDDYFRHLEQMYRREQLIKPSTLLESSSSSNRIPPSAFNQGYYAKFFRETRRLGRGARGQVFLVQHILEREYLGEYAVKKVPVGDNVEWLQRMLKEVHIMESLRHPNVISYKHAWLEVYRPTTFGPPVPGLFILMEFANRGNLNDLINQVQVQEIGFLSWQQILILFKQLCQGLYHLHSAGIIHRDLKPENILIHSTRLPEELQVLITDFGECNNTTAVDIEDRTGDTGTIEFCAPELYRRNHRGKLLVGHSIYTDIWSLGMILYYMIYGGRLPYSNIENVENLKREMLQAKAISLPKNLRKDIPPLLATLLLEMLSFDATQRPLLDDIIKRVESLLLLYSSTNYTRPRERLAIQPGNFSSLLDMMWLLLLGQKSNLIIALTVAPIILLWGYCYPCSPGLSYLLLLLFSGLLMFRFLSSWPWILLLLIGSSLTGFLLLDNFKFCAC